jgi:hypothetical protein
MQSPKLAGSKPGASTQKYLDISEIKDDCVVLKDGTMRAVVLVSSINFALKSEDEQNAIIYGYMNFLNAFDFPLQIIVQSRKLDMDGYQERLKIAEKEQTNELLKVQTAGYRQFISEIVELGEIMNKKFFIVVPYNPSTDKQKGFFRRINELFSAVKLIRLNEKTFQDYKKELFMRVNHVMGILNGLGLATVPLDTQSLIELYYNVYNPDVARNQKLADVGKLRVEG